MYKYLIFIGFFLFQTVSVSAQNKTLFFKVHPLKITDYNKQFADNSVDFGYNYTESIDNPFIRNGYYMWIQDQWYLIKNAEMLFKIDRATPLLFEVASAKNQNLKIEDFAGATYSYPLEAIETYAISQKDYFQWKSQPQAFHHSTTVIGALASETPVTTKKTEVKILSENSVKEPSKVVEEKRSEQVAQPKEQKSGTPILDVIEVTEVVKKQTDHNAQAESVEVISSVKNSESPLLDVIDIVEVSKEVVVPHTVVQAKETPSEKPVNKEEKETSLPPANAYEKAVAEGFDGSVSEWIEWVDSKGRKSAYQQALDAGFKGTEDEWKRSLWGSNVAPEIEEQEQTTKIVMSWMKELSQDDGYSPYEMALRHGFYGTFTEWVESVIGKDGEKAYNTEVGKGYKGTYKEWIEEKLIASNKEVQRKEQLRRNNFLVVPNVSLSVPETTETVATLDLYQYYNDYFGSSLVSSSSKTSPSVDIHKTDLEYQITWYNKTDIKILELSEDGILKYQRAEGEGVSDKTTINLRFLMKQ